MSSSKTSASAAPHTTDKGGPGSSQPGEPVRDTRGSDPHHPAPSVEAERRREGGRVNDSSGRSAPKPVKDDRETRVVGDTASGTADDEDDEDGMYVPFMLRCSARDRGLVGSLRAGSRCG